VRSLTLKLVLAFLATSVAATFLAGLFIRASVARGFDDYLLTQQRDAFVADVGAYYAANGSWQGIEPWLREQAADRRATAVADGGPRPGPPPKGGMLKVGPPGRAPFAIVDVDGVVVAAAEGYRPGQQVNPADLARGTPVIVDEQIVGHVIVPERPPNLSPAEQRYLEQTDWALAIAGAASIGLALALGVLLARVITRPVRDLTAAAERIAAGDLEQKAPVRSRDELGRLTVQFNQMSANLAHATALRRQMTADIAHDLRTPLTVIAGYLEALRDRVLPPTPERFATLYDETQLLLRLVEELHTLSLADAGELPLHRQPAAPRALLERAVETYRHTAERQGVELIVRADPNLSNICVDSELLARVLGNLVSNALRHTPPGGRITLAAEPAPSGARLMVSDTGDGIAPEHLASIFERFYRADAARSQAAGGSGLGLAIVKSLVEAHGGAVDVASAPGQGATFTITLPNC
jgi:signal transduction histidine kinase